MRQNSKLMFLLMVLAVGIFIASCKAVPEKTTDTKITKFESSQDLKKFSSADEVRQFLKNIAANAQDTGYYGGIGIRGINSAIADNFEAPVASKAADSGVGQSAADYSQTNIQVKGVDEADIVKNDGKYIYTITQNKLVIVDAFPAENAEIASETKIDGNPRDMFVNKDRLVIFSDGSGEVPVFEEYDFIPRPRYTSKTHVYVYDINNKANPKLVKDHNINGYYFQSRMIGNYVYFISKEDVYYYGGFIDLPVVKEASAVVARPDVFYFDNPEQNYVFHTVASFNVFDDSDKVTAKTYMMGYSNTVYVSENNLYITYQKNLPYTYYRTHNEDRFYEVVVPLLPISTQNKIKEIKNDDALSSYQKWERISDVLEDMYNNMEKDEKDKLIGGIEQAIEEYEEKLQAERSKTVIHKIAISNGQIDYGSKGEVPGYLLNQFSMDEKDGNLRVATTTEIWGRKRIMYNNVFVLNDNLETIGKIEAIAPDEKIYSTRFIGDRLYMVTFKRIDPLFVIDLSSPSKPEILGELKIPGFSDYLHPYDENHIIGIGKEVEGNEWGGISTKGLKLALFDVSDVKNPKPVDTIEIGEAGTDSEALRDHKAFLFDKQKNILVVPVTEVKGKLEYDPKAGYYKQRYWQGAYVLGITPADGFKIKGKITHNEGDENQDWYWYGSPNAVRRALYMDDVLYTVSMTKIKANDLGNIDKELKEIKLPYEKEQYPYPVPYMAEATAGSSGVAVK